LEGAKPFVCIYSTFLQRAYDQVIHDVVLQDIPVRFILDRAGLVGSDGATHHGTFDLAYLGVLPNIVIMAPSDEVELMNMIQTAYELNDKPSAVRFPRGCGLGLQKLNQLGYNLDEIPTKGKSVPIGKGRIIREGRYGDTFRVAILSLGTRLVDSMDAAEYLEADRSDVSVTVADARFMKPLDVDLINDLATRHDLLVTVEEGSVGGFGEHVLHHMAVSGLLDDGKIKVRPLVVPDQFIENATQDEQNREAGIDSLGIRTLVQQVLSGIPISRKVHALRAVV